jgi:hypothetical protein
MRAIAPAMRACDHDAASAAGTATGSVMNPPSPVMKPVEVLGGLPVDQRRHGRRRR